MAEQQEGPPYSIHYEDDINGEVNLRIVPKTEGAVGVTLSIIAGSPMHGTTIVLPPKECKRLEAALWNSREAVVELLRQRARDLEAQAHAVQGQGTGSLSGGGGGEHGGGS